MRRLGILTSQLILNHWSTEKQLRLRSDNTNIQTFVFDPLEMSDLEFTVDIAQGSMAGIDKDALNAFYMNLLSSQQITFEDFLMVADFPKKEILLGKLNERNQQAQQMQELQNNLNKLQEENIKLTGAKSVELLGNEERKVFDAAKRMALKKQLLEEAEQQNMEAQGMGQE
jgi:hypothetical protein